MAKTMLAENQDGFNPFLFSGRIFERKSMMPGSLEGMNIDKRSLWVGLNIRKKELSVKQRNHKRVSEAERSPGKGKDSIGP